MLDKIVYLLLLLLAAIIPFGYHPMFFNVEGERVGVISNITVFLVLFIFVLLLPRFNLFLKSSFIRVYIILVALISILILIFYAFDLNISISEIKALLLPLLLMFIGYSCRAEQIQIKKLGIIYVLVLLFVGLEQIRLNIGGFVIEDQYMTSAKNSLGAMLAIGGILSLLFVFGEKNKFLRIVFFLFSFLFFIELLTIRARLATLSYLCVAFFLFWRYISTMSIKNVVLLIFSIFLLVVLIGINYMDVFVDYFMSSFFQNREGDLLSGRGSGYSLAWQLLISYPILGNLTENIDLPWVHNYILLKLSDFGFVGGFLWLVLYLYIIGLLVKRVFKYNLFKEENFGYVLMVILFFISMGEPTFPYGPGTVVFIPFIMFGIAIHNSKYKYIKRDDCLNM